LHRIQKKAVEEVKQQSFPRDSIVDRIVAGKKATQKKIILRKEQSALPLYSQPRDLPDKQRVHQESASASHVTRLKNFSNGASIRKAGSTPMQRGIEIRQISNGVDQRQREKDRHSTLKREKAINYVVKVENLPEHFRDHRQLLDLLPRHLEVAGVSLGQRRARLEFHNKHLATQIRNLLNDTSILGHRLSADIVELSDNSFNDQTYSASQRDSESETKSQQVDSSAASFTDEDADSEDHRGREPARAPKPSVSFQGKKPISARITKPLHPAKISIKSRIGFT